MAEDCTGKSEAAHKKCNSQDLLNKNLAQGVYFLNSFELLIYL